MINQVLNNIDFSKNRNEVEYENCQLVNCNFTGLDLSNIKFIECEFEACNFTQTKWVNTSIQTCEFIACKMLGLDFSNVNGFLLSMSFDTCQLNLSNFYQLKLKKTKFINCQLNEIDFTETDLSQASFERSQLRGAIFEHSILAESDFRTAENFSIDPETNNVKKAKFSKDSLGGLLDKYQIIIDQG